MHTYARLRGFGLSVVPFAPYCIRRIGDGADDRISVEHAGLTRLLDPTGHHSAGSFGSVAELGESDGGAQWLVDFAGCSVSWPNHFSLVSSDLDGVPFELLGEKGASILVQGPFDPPPTEDQLTAPEQVVVGRGTADDLRWIELHYRTQDAIQWAQKHYLLTAGFIITAQAQRGDEPSVMPVAERLGREMLSAAQ